MKITRILSFLTAGIVALAITGCEKSNVSPKAADPESVKFSVFVDPSDSDVKSVVVTHNGDASLTWYGFLSEDLTSDLGELVSKKAATLSDKDLYAGNGHEFKCKTLAGVDYRFIVFGVNLDGKVYGEPVAAHVISSLSFALTPGELTGETVTVNVKHNGSDSNTWYGFITDDLETPAEKLVESNIPSNASEFMTGKDKDLLFEGLEPLSTYRVIVTGVTELGTFGEPAEITVKTAKYAQSKNYKLEYAGFYEDPDYVYINGLKVSVSDNASSKYFLFIDSAESVTDIYSFLDGAISSASSNLLSLASRYNVSVNDILFEGSQTIPVGLRNGKYIAAVITFDEEAEYAGDINWIEFEVVEPKASKVNPDWDLSVLCEPGSADDVYSVTVTNTVAESSYAYPYYLDFVNKNKVDEAGGIEEYINSVVEELGSSLEYIYDQYNYDMTYYGTKSDKYNSVPKGDYVIIAYGFTPETYFFTGQYAYKEVSIPDSSASGSPARVMSSMGFGSGKLNRFAIPSKK